MNVDSNDIYAYDPELYKMLIKYPAEMITLMDDAVKLAYADATQQNAEDVTLQVILLKRVGQRASHSGENRSRVSLLCGATKSMHRSTWGISWHHRSLHVCRRMCSTCV